jgi:hypothetical protein
MPVKDRKGEREKQRNGEVEDEERGRGKLRARPIARGSTGSKEQRQENNGDV